MSAPEVSPFDAHNQALLRNAHPADWINPTPRPRYHLVVIGGGTAGLVTAAGAAGLGARVALVEKHLLGGDCLNYGCVPSKTLLRSARAAAEARDAGRFGVRLPIAPEVDFAAVMERVRQVRAAISPHDSAERLRGLGVDVFLGEARFLDARTVAVGDARLRFGKAVIATGGRAAVPEVPGLREAGFLTNETVFSLTESPRRLAVLGGGPIGCELAQAFVRLGSQVSLLHRKSHLLDREDADAAERVQRALVRDGVALALEARLNRVERVGAGRVLHYSAGGAERTLEADAILVATGRRPNVEDLNLEGVGVAFDSHDGVRVNDRLQTTNRRIYGAGDVCLRWKFTHAADAAARIVIQNALFLGRKRASTLTIPWCTYTDPEVAHVGLAEHTACEQGIPVDVFTRELCEVDRARTDGEEEGFVKLIVAKGGDRILGATIVAPHAGDMIGEICVAMAGGLGLGRLASVIHPYPTLSEAIKHCADAWQRTRLTPGVKRLLAAWLGWTLGR